MPRTLSEAEFERVKAEVMAALPAGLREDEFDRVIKPRLAAALARAEELPPEPEGSALSRFTSNAGAALNPITMVSGLYDAARHPLTTAGRIYDASAQQGSQALEAYQQGRLPEALGHGLAMLPVVGPAAAAAGTQIAEGDVAGGLGASVGLVGSMLAPEAMIKAGAKIPLVPQIGKNVPAKVAAAVQWGLQRNIPVDVATATQNRFVRGVQRLSEESMGGSMIAEKARNAQGAALTATAEDLAAQGVGFPVTAEQAGANVSAKVSKTAANYDRAADLAYDQLRALEAKQAALIDEYGGIRGPETSARPFTKVPMAVDIGPTKIAMRAIYDELKAEAELVPLMGDKARALTALDRLMRAPDLAPLSIADRALGELKGLARVDDAFRRSIGQGVAAAAVKNLDQAVVAAAKQAGPKAWRALMDGRAATVNKVKTIEILDQLSKEPVGVFNQATWAKDAGVGRLRALARVAPNEVKQIGRAWMEQAITKATAEGGFSRAQGLFQEWQNLGPQTKQLIFKDAAHVRDLDQFFLLAKKMAENPNASGTALTLAKGGELAALYASPAAGLTYSLSATVLAKLLTSPRTTELLLQGLKIPVTATAARANWVAQMGRLLEEQGGRMAPAVADQQAPP